MSVFEKVTAIQTTSTGDGLQFGAEIPDHWQQGKGAFGGVVIGILARAIVASESEKARTLRSLTADLCAPALPGAVEISVTNLRRGTSMSFVDARMTQNGSLVARASAALASSRPIARSAIRALPPQPLPPRRPPWRDVPALPVEPPLGPVFGQNYEYRSTGPLPFSGGKDPITDGWIREKVQPESLDEAAIVGLLDAWWPTVFSVEAAPRAVATVGYTMQLIVDPRTLDAKEPLFYRARGSAGGDNFFIEMRELWSGDTVVAMNQQTFALLG
jgi:acyl-CoA thioesterase